MFGGEPLCHKFRQNGIISQKCISVSITCMSALQKCFIYIFRWFVALRIKIKWFETVYFKILEHQNPSSYDMHYITWVVKFDYLCFWIGFNIWNLGQDFPALRKFECIGGPQSCLSLPSIRPQLRISVSILRIDWAFDSLSVFHSYTKRQT